MEDALSSVVALVAVRPLGTKLPAERLLAAPSSLLYFLTLFMAFMADAEAAQRSFSTLLASCGSNRVRSLMSVSRSLGQLYPSPIFFDGGPLQGADVLHVHSYSACSDS